MLRSSTDGEWKVGASLGSLVKAAVGLDCELGEGYFDLDAERISLDLMGLGRVLINCKFDFGHIKKIGMGEGCNLHFVC